MFAPGMGSEAVVGGVTCIRTQTGVAGHAIYGPYQRLEPGRYAVEFALALAGSASEGDDSVCAALDVCIDSGSVALVSTDIRTSQLGPALRHFILSFSVTEAVTAEYRVHVTGHSALLIAGYQRLVAIAADADGTEAVEAGRFPVESASDPRFLVENRDLLRRLYERGVTVAIGGDDVVLTFRGISFFAREMDDVRFVDEIFFQNTYGVGLSFDTCVIDVGMNIALVSMLFASNDAVKEVHSFEPFALTFARGRANIGLNPSLAAKISPNNFGLADADDERVVLLKDEHDSGHFSIRGYADGTPHTIKVRDAAAVLGPIIAAAKAKNRRVVAKVDCEGAEFAIFDTLEAAGLLKDISAFLVEWHRCFPDKTQDDLIAPLLRHGFVALDKTVGTGGNGFFYAVKVAA